MDQPPLDSILFTEEELQSLRAMTKSSGSRFISALRDQRIICTECKKIDFRKAFKVDPRSILFTEETPLIAFLGTRCNQLPTNGCIVCQFLFNSKARTEEPGSVYELRALPYQWICPIFPLENTQVLGFVKQVYLAVVPRPFSWDYISRYQHRENGTLPFILEKNKTNRCDFSYDRLSPQADLDKAKHWLSYCRLNHSQSCRPNGYPSGYFQLIDCDTLDVVNAPNSALYAALSYVWGQPEGSEEALLAQQKYSRTILDAITVTKQIGLKYLWADRHCIDQDNFTKKIQQINQMDLIYSCAEITIIAADGVNAEAGLPGVASTARNPQITIDIDGITLISNVISPWASIPRSVWATRGWTLQEAVLSHRRLVFTDEQMYFECGVMNVSENMCFNLDIIHAQNKDKTLKNTHPGIFSGYQSSEYSYGDSTTRDLEEKYKSFVKDYTARALTYDEDSLKGFQGILNSLQNRDKNIKHVWGICFSNLTNFLDVLSWFHVREEHSTRRPYRRCFGEQGADNTKMPSIPSWSWAGWCGKVDCYPPHPGSMKLEVFSIKLGDEVLFPTPTTLPLNPHSSGLNQSITLEFEARMFPAEEILRVTQTRLYTKLDNYSGNRWFPSYEYTDLDDVLFQFKQKRYEVMIFNYWEYYGNKFGRGLVIENHLDFSTRIGMVEALVITSAGKFSKRIIKLR